MDVGKLIKIYKIFKERDLGVENDHGAGSESFDDFCGLMKRITDDQQELMMYLLQKYLRMGTANYIGLLPELLKKIDSYVNTGAELLFFSAESNENNKSGNFLLYCLKTLVKVNKIFKNAKINNSNLSNNEMIRYVMKKTNSYLILLDDFVGSGEQASTEAVKFLENGVNKNNFLVACFVAQKQGIEKLAKLGIDVIYLEKRDKAITEDYSLSKEERGYFIKTMLDIEESINVLPKESFGYNQVEATVTMGRTPNSTFPIFWKPNGKRRDNYIKAPFPRH